MATFTTTLRPQAAPAWERTAFDMYSPIAHPQQDEADLAGIVGILILIS